MLKWMLCGTLVTLSSVVSAKTLPCGEPNVENVEKIESKLYKFVISQTCQVEKSTEWTDLKAGMTKVLKENGVIRQTQTDVTHQEMTGVKMDYFENEADTGHGKIAVRYDLYLVGNENRVLLAASSTKIKATSHAENTKKVGLTVDYMKNDQGVTTLKVTKDIDVKRPWIAPESVFRDQSILGITKDLKRIVKQQEEMIDEL